MIKNLLNDCNTVTKNGVSYVYYKGVVLCGTVYEEHPSDIENMRIYAKKNDDETVSLVVETPVDYSTSDYHEAFTFDNEEEFECFLKEPYDPLKRGFYPIQDRIDRSAAIEITEHFGRKLNRVYIDSNLFTSFMISFYKSKTRFPDDSEVGSAFFDAYNLKSLELLQMNKSIITERSVKFEVNGLFAQASIQEDEFGEFIMIEYEMLDFNTRVRVDKLFDSNSKDVILTINGMMLDYLKYDTVSGYSSRYIGKGIGTHFVMDSSSQKIISTILSEHSFMDDAMTKSHKINESKRLRSKLIPRDFKIISREQHFICSICGLQILDYESYLA
ncbi:MAG: hypothetical protein IBX70_07620 [Clostridia bacterium]|nr:hypothetical protein [Clostridia bacterium]